MKTEKIHRPVQLIDTTLRDGAQAPDVSFSYDDKYKIVKMLYNAGLKMFEAAIPAMGESECRFVSDLSIDFPKCTFIAWCRADIEDLKKAQSGGCKTIHIAFPVSELHMSIMGFNRKSVIERLVNLTNYAKEHFLTVSVGAQDASRAESDFLIQFIRTAYECGVTRVRISDTVGILSPATTMNLISAIKDKIPGCPLEFHAHNDLGMATANTITALQAGAEFASVTVNGIGERAGNAPIEEVVMAIYYATELNTSFETSEIYNICQTVSDMINVPIPRSKAVSGSHIFTHESGIHCNGQLKNNTAYEPYHPQSAGRDSSQFVAGTHSGKSGIKAILKNNGIYASSQLIDEFISIIRIQAIDKGKSLNEVETVRLFREKYC